MSILQSLAQEKRQWGPLDDRWYTDLVPALPESGEPVNDNTAMTLSAVFLAISVISGALGMLPLRLMRRTGDNTNEPAEEHPLYRLMDVGPNDWQTSMEWREMLQGHLLLRGNAFSQIVRTRGGEVLEIRPIAPDRVTIDIRGDVFMYEVAMPDGSKRRYSPEQILHLKGLSGNGIIGHSPIHIARESFGISLASERHAARTFGNGARPSGILRTDEQLSNEARKNLQESWTTNFGSQNAYKTAVLDEGLSWQQVGFSNEDAQFLESRRFQVAEVARWFNIPNHKLKDLERATFSNIEQQALEFVQDTVQPWIVRWEARLRKQLLTPVEQETLFFKFNLNSLLRADQESRSAYYTALFQLGVLSTNDIRALEDMNPVDQGDQRFVPLNMVPLDMVEEVQAPSEPEPMQAEVIEEEPNAEEEEEDEDDERSLPTPRLLIGPEGFSRLRQIKEERQIRLRNRLQNRTYRRLLEDVARRIIAREQNALTRIIREELNKGGLDSLNARITSFYENRFQDYIALQVRPVLAEYVEDIRDQIGEEIGLDNVQMDVSRATDEYIGPLTLRHMGRSQGELTKTLKLAGIEDDIETHLLTTVDSWRERRVNAWGIREATKAGGYFALAAMAAAGVRRMGWRAVGQSCPLCQMLDGSVVSINEPFKRKGDLVDPQIEGTKPLMIQGTTRHPPLHGGCDCILIPIA